MDETQGAVAMLEDKTQRNGMTTEKVVSAAAKPDKKAKPARPEKKALPYSDRDKPGKPETLDILEIDESNGIQMRARIDEGQVDRFRRVYEGREGDVARADDKQGVARVVVWRDPETKVNRLTDGFQRLKGAKAAGKTRIEAEVHTGGFNDAVIAAAGSNADQWGVPRKHADIQNALRRVFALTNDKGERYMEKMSAGYIAKICKVSDKTVTKYREELTGKPKPATVTRADGVQQEASRPRESAKPEKPAKKAAPSLDSQAKEWVKGIEMIRKLPAAPREANTQAAVAWYKLTHSAEYQDFARLVRKTLKDVSNVHPVYRKAKGFLSLKSPADWKTCGSCDGTGVVVGSDGKATGKSCQVCKGLCLVP